MTKTWLITGASSGLGRLLTEALLERGDRVAATVRRPEVLEHLRSSYGEQLWIGALDVTDRDQTHQTIDAAFDALGTIDVVVNNAGYGVFASVEEASDDQIRQVVDTNLLGSIHVIRAALPHLRRQQSGHILQISTAGGQTTYPNFSYYHATKWGIEGFSETVAKEIEPFGIAMTIVQPGATPTGFGSALATAPIMPEYDVGPAGDTRRALEDGSFQIINDPHKIIKEVIAVVDQDDPPLRLPLGRDAYQDVRASLVDRLAEHDTHREKALAIVQDEYLDS